MEHKQHKGLKRLPVIDGWTLINSAITGASYHQYQIKSLLDSFEQRIPISKDDWPRLSNNETNLLHWHLRDFFWELVGAYDLLLQWSNERFALGHQEDKIFWNKIRNTDHAEVDKELWNKVKSCLQQAMNSEWYFEIKTYRNFSHRSFLNITVLTPKNGTPQIFLEPAREGQNYEDIRISLHNYLDKFKSFADCMQKIVNDHSNLD